MGNGFSALSHFRSGRAPLTAIPLSKAIERQNEKPRRECRTPHQREHIRWLRGSVEDAKDDFLRTGEVKHLENWTRRVEELQNMVATTSKELLHRYARNLGQEPRNHCGERLALLVDMLQMKMEKPS